MQEAINSLIAMKEKDKAVFIGKKYGRLQCLPFVVKWKILCRCDCGNEKLIYRYDITGGHTKSCGCFRNEQVVAAIQTHGHSKRRQRSGEYESWAGIIQRTTNEENSEYRNYGGRGIAVCERWKTFANFLDDMGIRPKGFSIERIDVNGNYEKANCVWANAKTQSRNKRDSIWLTIDGRTLHIKEWSEISGTKYDTIHHRVTHGNSARESVFGK